jgi:endonuclease I
MSFVHPRRRRCAAATLALASTNLAAQSLPITGGTPAVETFDTLAASGTGTTLPNGWYFAETGSNANTTYAATDGSANSGDTYSYGASAASERALGALRSNSNGSTIGAQLHNATGATLTQLQVSYTGEQWRIGTLARADRLDFQYSTDATSLNTGTWVDVDALDFASPNTSGPIGPLDGNASANQGGRSALIGGLALAPGATLWVRWTDFDPGTNEDGLAIDGASFGLPGDFAPAVASTQPANGAGNVPAATNLVVTFTEPVTLAGSWFGASCSISGTLGLGAFVVSGGPVSYTLDPVVDFAANETCTATVAAANVTDLDGTPDTMGADAVFGFTIAPPPVDVPPTVSATTPGPNASNVSPSANLGVTFSEPVTLNGAWFALSCVNSGAHTAVVSGGPSAWQLNPDADFSELESCALTVLASQVSDQDGTPDAMTANHVLSFTTRAGAADYYDSVDASSCAALRTTLHAAIDDHTAFPYSASTTDTWDILEAADQDPLDAARVLEVYENVSYAKAGGGNANYNREHTWPNSYGFNDLSGLDGNGQPWSAYTDTHMLYLSDIEYNADRGSKPYADCPSSEGCSVRATQVHNGFGGGPQTWPGNHNWVRSAGSENQGSFEVWNHRKGDLARAVLYMDIRYEGGTHSGTGQPEPDLIVTDDRGQIQNTPSGQFVATGYMGLKATLLAWHAADPPDLHEQLRNDVVFGFQGNRNPFIDHPEWAACLYQCQCSAGPPDLVFGNGFEE